VNVEIRRERAAGRERRSVRKRTRIELVGDYGARPLRDYGEAEHRITGTRWIANTTERPFAVASTKRRRSDLEELPAVDRLVGVDRHGAGVLADREIDMPDLGSTVKDRHDLRRGAGGNLQPGLMLIASPEEQLAGRRELKKVVAAAVRQKGLIEEADVINDTGAGDFRAKELIVGRAARYLQRRIEIGAAGNAPPSR